jgi:hypothetical protein
MKLWVMGIDPGAHGAISIVSPDGDKTESFPLYQLTDLEIFLQIAKLKPRVSECYLEQVRPIQGAAANSTWKFSGSYHGLRMALVSVGIRFLEVRPPIWQGKMRCLTKGDKKVSRAKAQELFPGIKITHDTADSILIAEYGRLWGA